jgi:hypothetical protein
MAAHAAQKKIGVLEKSKNWSDGKEQGLENWSAGVMECWKRTRAAVVE